MAIASLGAGYALRVYRWAIMLRAYKPEVAFRSCAAPYLGSIALNNLLPFRAGDVVRALVFPNSLGVSKTDSTISLVIERIIDVLVLIVFFIISMIVSGTRYFPATIVKGSIILGTMLIPFMILLILFSSRIANSLKKRREKTAEGTYRRKVLDAFYKNLGECRIGPEAEHSREGVCSLFRAMVVRNRSLFLSDPWFRLATYGVNCLVHNVGGDAFHARPFLSRLYRHFRLRRLYVSDFPWHRQGKRR